MGGVALVVTLLLACVGAPVDAPAGDTGSPTTRRDPPALADRPGPRPPAEDTAVPPVDSDGDGVSDDEDCAPEDPRVYPGAADWCDGVDQDCDGDPVGAGMCGEVNLLDRMETRWWEGTAADGSFNALTAGRMDGRATVIGGQNAGSLEDVSFFAEGITALRGPPESEGVPWPTGSVGVWATGPYDHFIRSRFAGDFDGDGHDDLWWISAGMDGCCEGAAYLIRGPSDRWPTAAYIRDVADASWLDAVPNDNFAMGVDAGDVTGDGRADLLVHSMGNIWTSTGGSLHLVPGRPAEELPSGRSIGDEVTLFKSDGGEDDWAYYVNVGPDFDGDGAAEVLYSAQHALGVISGSEFAASDGGAIADLVRWNTEPDDDRWVNLSPQGMILGDLDGDGYEEFVLSDGKEFRDPSSSDQCVLIGSPAGELPEGALADIVLSRACVTRERGTGVADSLTLGDDLDGDAIGDLVFLDRKDVVDAEGWPVSTNVAAILPSSRLALGGTVDVDDVALWYGFEWFTEGPEMNVKWAAVSDLDDDGAVDLVVSDTEWSSEKTDRLGRVVVLPGFEIPWDDPTKW